MNVTQGDILEEKRNRIKMVKTHLFRKPTFVMKVVELVMTIICVALVSDMWYVAMTPTKTAVVNGTFVGYIMLSVVVMLGLWLDVPLDRTLVLLITLAAVLMFFASGSIMMQAWNNYGSRADRLLASGILAFLNGFIYLADFVCSYFTQRSTPTR